MYILLYFTKLYNIELYCCEFSKILTGNIPDKHITTWPLNSDQFSIYSDDSLDLLKSEEDLEPYKQHLSILQPKLDFEKDRQDNWIK